MTPQEAAARYHWIKYDQQTNTIEMYLDNFMLSSARLCEAKFALEHLLWYKPRYVTPEVPDGKVFRKPWFFDFGEYIHWCLEQFYNSYKVYKTAPPVDIWLDQCKMKWALMRMDDYKNSVVKADVEKYEDVKGWTGVCGLLTQYYVFYMDIRLLVIDTEITFGHNKEVKIGTFDMRFETEEESYQDAPLVYKNIECYLTGRIDLLVDNGYKIGPVDHKTTHKFDGYEHADFNPNDGITGYILAIHDILENYPITTDSRHANIQCMGGWIYHISATTPPMPNKNSRAKGKTQEPRFKTTPIDKSPVQLADYKARQLSTFKRIAELLFNDKVPEWNTTACNNMFFRSCEYKPIHEQPSDQWPSVLERFYQITNPWDTRDHSNKEEKNANENVTTTGDSEKGSV